MSGIITPVGMDRDADLIREEWSERQWEALEEPLFHNIANYAPGPPTTTNPSAGTCALGARNEPNGIGRPGSHPSGQRRSEASLLNHADRVYEPVGVDGLRNPLCCSLERTESPSTGVVLLRAGITTATRCICIQKGIQFFPEVRAMNIVVDRASGEPVYEQIARQIRLRIAVGELPPGTQLPSVRTLASDLGLNLNTVARAYRVLEENGFVRIRSRSGAEVEPPHGRASDDVRRRLRSELKQLLAEMRQAGIGPNSARAMVEELLAEHRET